jgi:hypothetical protein
MVNHFATLLINLDLKEFNALRERYLLADNSDLLLLAQSNNDRSYKIALGDYYTELEYMDKVSLYINRKFKKVALPEPLTKFYEMLFPAEASFHYKHFLLYSCLRLIAATVYSDDVAVYDNRLTYSLDDSIEYFRFSKIFTPAISSNAYDIIVTGQVETLENIEESKNSFIVRQVGNTPSVTVFSATQKKYYKAGKIPTQKAKDMEIPLIFQGRNSAQIPVGDVGLKFSFTGDMTNFTGTANKNWRFAVQAPFNFKFQKIMQTFKIREDVVTNMLRYAEDKCNSTYSNLWLTHYNDVYRFAGLLMAYVERVNSVWLENRG